MVHGWLDRRSCVGAANVTSAAAVDVTAVESWLRAPLRRPRSKSRSLHYRFRAALCACMRLTGVTGDIPSKITLLYPIHSANAWDTFRAAVSFLFRPLDSLLEAYLELPFLPRYARGRRNAPGGRMALLLIDMGSD